jgi:hypothetical protein
MKQIVSFCLWGTNPIYLFGAVQHALQIGRVHYLGWTPRFYFTQTLPGEIRHLLKYLGAELEYIDQNSCPAPIWALNLVASDKTVDRWICRGSECRIESRELNLVKLWEASGKQFHLIKDHPGCSMHPIYSGLWGGVGPVEGPGLRDQMFSWAKRQPKPVHWTEEKRDWFFRSQEFLWDAVWPQVQNKGFLLHWTPGVAKTNSQYSHYSESCAGAEWIPGGAAKDGSYIAESFGVDGKHVCQKLRDSRLECELL